MMDSDSTSMRGADIRGRAGASRAKLRLIGLSVAVPCWAALVLAYWLEPRAGGYGTHEQLGLPACSFLSETRWPCPSCGLTTSVTAMAHGKLIRAFRAHPFGIVVFALAVILGLAGTAQLITGRKLISKLRVGPWWVAAGIIGLLGGWALNLLTGYATGRLPVP